MKNKEPSAGALRAAARIDEAIGDTMGYVHSSKFIGKIGSIIDRETRLKELIEALENVVSEECNGRSYPNQAFQECDLCRETSSQDNPGWQGIKHHSSCAVGNGIKALAKARGTT
ncbi:hypothetical protein LCGC14_1059460 [marine sediment metagenome]|uniref:Uncharacterized protein n=1 Tax=marine sediment metagenome TaxID=412755 RepID=A0A0F9MR64_9ZZZZ